MIRRERVRSGRKRSTKERWKRRQDFGVDKRDNGWAKETCRRETGKRVYGIVLKWVRGKEERHKLEDRCEGNV